MTSKELKPFLNTYKIHYEFDLCVCFYIIWEVGLRQQNQGSVRDTDIGDVTVHARLTVT